MVPLVINADAKQQALGRLRRDAGQVQGIQRMIGDAKYCMRAFLPISAVQGAREQASKIVMSRPSNVASATV